MHDVDSAFSMLRGTGTLLCQSSCCGSRSRLMTVYSSCVKEGREQCTATAKMC